MDLHSVNTAQSAIVQQSYTKTGKTAEKETYSKKTYEKSGRMKHWTLLLSLRKTIILPCWQMLLDWR